MRHEKSGLEQRGRTPSNGWDKNWQPVAEEESAKADTPKPLSFRSKIGEMATTFAEWIKREDTDKSDRPLNDQNNSDATATRENKDISELIETILTPEQQQEVRETATKLAEAIVKDDQPVSEDLVEKLAVMEQPVRDCTIKEMLFWTQLEHTNKTRARFARPISQVTQFLTDRQLPLESYDGLAKTTISFLDDLTRFLIDVDEAPYAYFVNGALNDRQVGQQIKLELAKKKFDYKIDDIARDIILGSFTDRKRDTKNLAEFAKGLKNVGYDVASRNAFLQNCIAYPPIQKLTLMVKNRHYLWTIL